MINLNAVLKPLSGPTPAPADSGSTADGTPPLFARLRDNSREFRLPAAAR